MYFSLRMRYSYAKMCLMMACLTFIITVNQSFLQSSKFSGFWSVFYCVKAFLYRVFNIATDTNVYVSEQENVYAYSQFNSRYLVNNEHLCSVFYPLVLIFVKVCAKDFEIRQVIRETWGNVTSWSDFDVSNTDVMVLFVLGKNKLHFNDIQINIEHENDKFHDIIQEDFVEDFYNLTLKMVGQLKWPLKYCRGAQFWMTTDSDVFVHVGNLVSHLKKQKPEGYYSGLVHFGSHRVTDTSSKYHVSENVYKGVYYPDYCPGGGYILSMDVVDKIFQKVPHTPMIYIDDLYVGILAHYCAIHPTHYVMLLGEKSVSTDLCTLSKFITSHGHDKQEMRDFYKEIKLLSYLDPNVLCWNSYLSWMNPFDLVYFR